MATKLLQQHRVVLKTLYESADGLNVFTLAKRTSLNPFELARTIVELECQRFVRVDGTRILLTSEGDELFVGVAGLSFSNERPWRSPPKDIVVTPLPPFRPYTPQITGVDSSLLPERFVTLVKSLRREKGNESSTLE